jgi:hypothetical protein
VLAAHRAPGDRPRDDHVERLQLPDRDEVPRAAARAARRRVVETPIVFVDRRVGQSKMSRAIVLEALAMVWKLRFGRTSPP